MDAWETGAQTLRLTDSYCMSKLGMGGILDRRSN